MNKAEKKFRLYAILVIFVLLTVLLAVINGVNFTMAAGDADEITQMLAERQGAFDQGETARAEGFAEKGGPFSMGPLGPESPEMNKSLRYFTVAFTEKGENAETVAFHISAVSESEAVEWAKGLIKEKTGWTRGSYRYRVYKRSGITYVTVIDQGRELLPCFRILIISAAGEILSLIIAWIMLLGIGRKVYAPLEEADRKQKNFIKNANKEFRVPITVISGNTELAEKQYGPDDRTRSTRRQLAKLGELVEKLGKIGIFEASDAISENVPLSEYLNAAIDGAAERFASRGLDVRADIEPDITVTADPETMDRMTGELIDNSLKFALHTVYFTLKQENGYVLLETKNDASLPDGSADQVFDRFTTLENSDGTGLGLSYVKDIVKSLSGRVSARVENGMFILRITL
jgi:signal transduction histidine kinase